MMREPGDRRSGKRTWELNLGETWEVYAKVRGKGISTARFKMNNCSSDIHVVRIEYSGEWLELKKTGKKKWKLRSSPPLPTPALLVVLRL